RTPGTEALARVRTRGGRRPSCAALPDRAGRSGSSAARRSSVPARFPPGACFGASRAPRDRRCVSRPAPGRERAPTPSPRLLRRSARAEDEARVEDPRELIERELGLDRQLVDARALLERGRDARLVLRKPDLRERERRVGIQGETLADERSDRGVDRLLTS